MASLRKAINATCKECIYDPYDTGTWRKQVQACTSPKCPLYPLRPLPIAKNLTNSKEKTPETTHLRSVPMDRVFLVENDDESRLFSSKSAEGGDT